MHLIHDLPVVHTGLEFLKDVLIELVDLTNVDKHPLYVGVWHHVLTPCIEVFNCLVEVDSNQLQMTNIAGGLGREMRKRR